MTCDIFCRVIDNYGDIGVCWRLARQLSAEHGIKVRLMVDQLSSFSRIAPEVDPGLLRQNVANIEVFAWTEALDLSSPADLVIEAFACELPARYLRGMAERHPAPQWINLEYLSAEPWVAGHHLLPSPHSYLPLTKHFFFPGFTPGTGGLIREADVGRLPGANATAKPVSPLRVFVFAYESAPVDRLIHAIPAEGVVAHVTVPAGRSQDKLKNWRGQQAENALEASPLLGFGYPDFVPQPEFDALLRAHDVLFIRGEDSFVRAQWAAQPFVWQIYPQAEGAHWVKLNAFLDLYCEGLEAEAAQALRDLWHVWNGAVHGDLPAAWNRFLRSRAVLQAHAIAWADKLMQMPDLASNLLSFYKKNAKI
ncbi:MAG: elongation factor P maturation arginine rhamnosyltransferase EarP [Betaproteobacteria bacterium]|nr:elongation factor P maturation arginine rhamnosyltransferase EarP [Betaproteobacteria bacterium]